MTVPVLVLNGPNLNLLGEREPELYGSGSLADLEQYCRAAGRELDLAVEFRQSNHEGALIEAVHAFRHEGAGIVINPGGYSHTSVALMDALLACTVPVVEVHLSNIHRREPFRDHSYVSRAAAVVIAGAGHFGYRAALEYLAQPLAGHR